MPNDPIFDAACEAAHTTVSDDTIRELLQIWEDRIPGEWALSFTVAAHKYIPDILSEITQLRAAQATAVPVHVYESAVNGRRQFRTAYREAKAALAAAEASLTAERERVKALKGEPAEETE